MSKYYISSSNFEEGKEIPKKFGYKHGNQVPEILFFNQPENTKGLALIMDDPDAMAAVGKVWVHWLSSDLSPQTVAILSGETPMKTLREGEEDDKIELPSFLILFLSPLSIVPIILGLFFT